MQQEDRAQRFAGARRRFFAVRCAMMAFALSAGMPAAQTKSQPPRDDPPTGRILYFEESGGFLTPGAPPKGIGAPSRESTAAPGKAAPTRLPPPLPPRLEPPKAPPAPGKQTARKSTPTPIISPGSPPPKSTPAPITEPEATAQKSTPTPISTPISEAELARQRYAATLGRHVARPGTAAERARALADEAGPDIVGQRDHQVATSLGWLFMEGKDPASAGLWFERARTWTAERDEPTRGLARAALAENDFDRALAAALEIKDAAEREPLVREARLGLAVRHYRAERYADSYRELTSAGREDDLPRYARTLTAWSALQLGERREAAQRFAALYREVPDLEAAQGLMATAAAAPIEPTLARVEPLAGLIRRKDAERAAGERRFLEARALDPERYGSVGAITSAYAAVASSYRDKSGDVGTSRLRQRPSESIEVSAPLEGAMSVRARWERQSIDAGNAETRVDLDYASLGFHIERGVAIDAVIGHGPAGGAVSARTFGAVEIAAAPEWGQVTGAVYSAPVRESVLSTAGIRDNATGEVRGGVMRHGIEARALWLQKAPWSAGARAYVARLDGTGVDSNRQRGAEVSGGYELGLKGFAYSAASVSLGTERYQKNLVGFAPGDGGYFSPQGYRRAGAAFDFMTAEGRPWILRGRLATGWIRKREDAIESSGRDYSAQIAGSVRLAPHVHGGFALARGLSPQYRETQALLKITVLLEPRLIVASADIPVFGR